MPKISKNDVIDVGYALFALEGPEHIEERVEQEMGLKHAEFLSRFGAEEIFIEALIAHHIELVDDFLEETEHCTSWDPALLNLIVDYKLTVLFNRQLKQHSGNPVFHLTYNRISYLVQSHAFELWRKYMNLHPHMELSRELYEVLRDVFHSRITRENLNYEYLKSLAGEFRTIIEKLIHLQQTVLQGN